MVWTKKDSIGLFPYSGIQIPLYIKEGAGSKNATFKGEGWNLERDVQYFAYHPLIGNFYLNKNAIPLSMEGQKQTGNGSYAHLGKYDYMAASCSSINDKGVHSFQFDHLGAILHLSLTMPKAGTYKNILLEKSGGIVTKSSLNLTDGSLTPVKTSVIQTLNLKEVEVNNDNGVLDIYTMLFPMELQKDSIVAKVYDEVGNCYSTSLKQENYLGNHIYNLSLTTKKYISPVVLPKVLITTPDDQLITSKDVYIDNSFLTFINTEGITELSSIMKIKGRGNTTWHADKKPYAIKFDKKESFYSLPKDKSWILLANYYDPTFIRNDVAFYMGNEMSYLDYTPHYFFVDLSLNGKCQGIYQLGEKIKISENRVNVGDDGFLLEIDAKAGAQDVLFRTPHLGQPVNIKDPDVKLNDEDYNYIKDYVIRAEDVLFSDLFLDEKVGYKQYLDVKSFVEWYLINEISKNNDACFYGSCYMNLRRGGKLKMGPIWDFDLAFGNTTVNRAHKTDGFWVKTASWYERLFEDPDFVEMVKKRFSDYYNNRQMIYDHIDEVASQIREKIKGDNDLWGTVSSKTSTIDEVIIAYQGKVDGLKEWIETRFQWIKANIDELYTTRDD